VKQCELEQPLELQHGYELLSERLRLRFLLAQEQLVQLQQLLL
jgi:hypothetical protein